MSNDPWTRLTCWIQELWNSFASDRWQTFLHESQMPHRAGLSLGQFPSVRSLTRVKCPGIAPGGDGRFWNWLVHKLTNQCSCPEFLAASCRCQLKVKLAGSVVLGSRISSSFAELKGHEHVAKAVTVGINTCCCISVSRAFGVVWWWLVLKSDYLTWKWHPNKIYTRFLSLIFGSITLLLL